MSFLTNCAMRYAPNAFRGRDWDLASACRQSPSGAGAPVPWSRRCCPLSPEYQRERPIQLGGTAFSMIINDVSNVSFYMLAPRRASPAFSSWPVAVRWKNNEIIWRSSCTSDPNPMFWAKLGTRSEQRLNQEVRAHFIGPQELLVLRWDLSSCFSPNTVSLNRISTFLKPRLGG